MSELEIDKINFHYLNETPCVYKLWLNNHYYIGCTSNLNNRLNTHISIIKRINKGYSISIPSKKVYRKFIKLLKEEAFVNITFEVLSTFTNKKEAVMHETEMLYSNKSSHFILNNIKKK